jgi:predicted ATPase
VSLKVQAFHAEGYRSLRAIRFPVDPLTVFVGANGAGKTNLYRGLQLLQAAATGDLGRELAAEGGMDSAAWAGVRRAGKPVQIRLGAELAVASVGPRYRYQVTVGLPAPVAPAFRREAQVKAEEARFETRGRGQVLLSRKGERVLATPDEGKAGPVDMDLLPSETALSRLEDPSRYPDLHLIRQTLADWRFHHDLRTDAASPLRRPCLAVTGPTLDADGGNLAAVFATLFHIRQDTRDLDRAVADAFPGATLIVPEPERTASFGMVFPDYPKRVFEAAELSDGTLRFLALAGALMAYRPPAFIALNEPESSLHPDLLDPLARMIVAASERTQVWLVTHSERLAGAIARFGGPAPRTVVKRDGATWIEGLKLFGDFEDEAE